MKKFVSSLCILLSLLTVCCTITGLLSGCSAAADEISKSSSGGSTANVQQTAKETEELPVTAEADYKGREVMFLMSVIPQWSEKNDFGSGEMNGDVLNDAYYTRNKSVEEKLNIKLSNKHVTDDAYQIISKLVQSGDTVYDAAIMRGYYAFQLAQENYLYDLNTLPVLDLSHSWWDAGACRDLAFYDHLYMTTGDMSTIINDDSSVMLFNKTVAETYSLGNMYGTVKSGGWTFDKLGETVKNVAGDVDGDGKMGDGDRYGAIIWDDSMMAIVNAVGEHCCKAASDGSLVLTLNTERVVGAVTKYLSIVDNTDVCFAYQRSDPKIYDTTADNMFTGNRSLFFFELLNRVSRYRDMDSDFGILPYPKYDAAQENYYTNVGSYPSLFVCVPSNTADPEMTGVLLDELGYESHKTVRPAYYEKTLKGKYIRDEESSEMLDIIFSTRVYDIGWFLQVGGYNEEIMNIFRYKTTNFSSMYAKYESKALSEIEKLNQAYSEHK